MFDSNQKAEADENDEAGENDEADYTDFLSNCYVSEEQLADPEYQAVVEERWAAAVAEMREYD